MITQVTYGRVFNLGNYESLRLEATAAVDDGDTDTAWVEARAAVDAQRRILVRREAMMMKIETLRVDARERRIEIQHKPLDQATDDELITIGKAYTAALEKRSAGVEEVDLPA